MGDNPPPPYESSQSNETESHLVIVPQAQPKQQTIAFAKDPIIVLPAESYEKTSSSKPDHHVILVETAPQTAWYHNKSWQHYFPTNRKTSMMVLVALGMVGLIVGITVFLIVFFSTPEVPQRRGESYTDQDKDEWMRRYFDNNYF